MPLTSIQLVRRRMAIDDVGRALSHMRAWHVIAGTLADGEYAIVLEDNVEFEWAKGVNVSQHLDELVTSASTLDLDIINLSYRNEDCQERKQVDKLFTTYCPHNHWTVAYMIRPIAAQKLVDEMDAYRKNLISLEKYLSIIAGTLDHNSDETHSDTSCGVDHESTGSCKVTQLRLDPRYQRVRLSSLALRESFISPPSDVIDVERDAEIYMEDIYHYIPPSAEETVQNDPEGVDKAWWHGMNLTIWSIWIGPNDPPPIIHAAMETCRSIHSTEPNLQYQVITNDDLSNIRFRPPPVFLVIGHCRKDRLPQS